ncbi:Uncharacterised protein [Mycobacteroides abscessus subsp. abscessus]|nr:Uncharacterised protein [Mycobacteroides abscessus subsp. abscessus]
MDSRNALVSAATSMGSPTGVPVPCASTMPIELASTPATACAAMMTSLWAVTLGAVNPVLCRPSLLTALPLTTARIRSPSASASDRRLSSTTPTPSPGNMPAAAASKARHRPSGESGPLGVCR